MRSAGGGGGGQFGSLASCFVRCVRRVRPAGTRMSCGGLCRRSFAPDIDEGRGEGGPVAWCRGRTDIPQSFVWSRFVQAYVCCGSAQCQFQVFYFVL